MSTTIFGRSLTLQIAIATIIGVLVGILFGDLCEVFSPWANAYIMVLKVTAIPYLIVAIMHGVGQMTDAQGKQILKKGFLFVILAWVINISVIYLLVFFLPQPKGMQQKGFFTTETSNINFAELLIPDNIFNALANNVIPAVVIFSLFIGLALMHTREKGGTMAVLETAIESLTRITRWISLITPFGTFLIIANQVGTVHISTIKQIGTYIILFILGALIIVFWIFPRIVNMLTPVTASKWIKDIFPILILAYTTNAVIVCLPFIIQLVQKETHDHFPRDEKALMPTQGIVSVIFNLPLAALFISFFIFFASIFYQHPLSMKGQLELFATTFLTGLGAVGIGSWINSLSFILDSLGLPAEAVKLYLTTVPITAGFQSMIATMEIATLSFLITLACRGLIKYKWSRFIRNAALTLGPIFLLAIGIKSWNFLPSIQNPSKNIEELEIQKNINAKVYTTEKPPTDHSREDTLDRILKTKTLRVGYYPCIQPFCFYNRVGHIVGYDIAFAYELADDLGCNLEFVPLNYSHLKEELEEGLYDIAMSAVSISEERLKYLNFTTAYIESKFVLVVPTSQKKAFERFPLSKDQKIAALEGSSMEYWAKEFFPNQEFVPINDYEDFYNNDKKIALLWSEQEAISWIFSHPYYTLVYPDPAIGTDSFGYAIRPDSLRFLAYLDQWLELKKRDGFTTNQYNLWILRKTEGPEQKEPRWSIIHNVFKWTK